MSTRLVPAGGRHGFTLVELLVVMTVIILVASITALFLPDILRSDKLVQGANTVQNMLMVARQRAIRDQAPVGVRFYTATDPVVSTRTICTEMAYVEQPDDFVIPTDTITSVSAAGLVTVKNSSSTDFSGGLGAQLTISSSVLPVAEQFPVQTGDYLMINYPGGAVSMITSVSQTTPGPTPSANPFNQLNILNKNNYTSTTGSYGIIRAPRRVRGEDSVKLPTDVVIVISDSAASAVGTNPSSGTATLPQRSITVQVNSFTASPAQTFSEIVFGPNGAVVGTDGSSPGNLIKIWVWDSSRDGYLEGQPLFVVVSPLTGRIAIQPVDPSNGLAGPFDALAKDLHVSGM